MRGRMVGVRERGREGVPGRQCERELNRRSSTQSPLGSAFHLSADLLGSHLSVHLSGFYVPLVFVLMALPYSTTIALYYSSNYQNPSPPFPGPGNHPFTHPLNTQPDLPPLYRLACPMRLPCRHQLVGSSSACQQFRHRAQ